VKYPIPKIKEKSMDWKVKSRKCIRFLYRTRLRSLQVGESFDEEMFYQLDQINSMYCINLNRLYI
jgi:hypothetical protein